MAEKKLSEAELQVLDKLIDVVRSRQTMREQETIQIITDAAHRAITSIEMGLNAPELDRIADVLPEGISLQDLINLRRNATQQS